MTRLPSHFYAMCDPAGGHEPVALARLLLEAGARIIQLRQKDASARAMLAAACEIAPLCQQRGALFIVNDRVDIAMIAGADGVHLGQDDLPIAAARRIAGSPMIVGISTHNSEQARAAEAERRRLHWIWPDLPRRRESQRRRQGDRTTPRRARGGENSDRRNRRNYRSGGARGSRRRR